MTCGLYSKNVNTYCICMCNEIIHYITVLRGEGIYVLSLVAQSYPTLCKTMDCNMPGSSVHGNSAGKNTGVGCHALLQGIFPTQGLNPGFLHCRQFFTDWVTREVQTDCTNDPNSSSYLYMNHLTWNFECFWLKRQCISMHLDSEFEHVTCFGQWNFSRGEAPET